MNVAPPAIALPIPDAIDKDLQVMDQVALSLCREQKPLIVIFTFSEKGNLAKVVEVMS